MPAVYKQKIPARYVKVDVLKNLLIEWYGNGNFEFEVDEDDQVIIITLYNEAAGLSDAQIERIRDSCF